MRYVGSHKGPITCIHIPRKQDGELSEFILSGSVDGHIKIWDYQGKVIQRPTVLIQTLYGHTGTVTGLFAYGRHILSSSTDRTIKAWKAVEGRGQLVYPWYDLQVGLEREPGIVLLVCMLFHNCVCVTLRVCSSSMRALGYAHALWTFSQATVATLDGWVRSMSFDKSREVGDRGTFYAVDEHGNILRVLPEEVHDDEGKR